MTAPNHVKFQETKKVWKKMLLPYLRKGAFYLSFGSFFPFSRSQFKLSRQKQRRKKGEKIEEREAEQEEGGGDRDLCTVRAV